MAVLKFICNPYGLEGKCRVCRWVACAALINSQFICVYMTLVSLSAVDGCLPVRTARCLRVFERGLPPLCVYGLCCGVDAFFSFFLFRYFIPFMLCVATVVCGMWDSRIHMQEPKMCMNLLRRRR